MSSTDGAESLRERTRRAVQQELIDAAQTLFENAGYESVTIDQISGSVGMSRRSFFRYFGSKDALVLGKYDHQAEAFVAALAARPIDEAPWLSLRRMFDDSVAYLSDPITGPRALALQAIITESDTLRAGYVDRLQRAQRAIVDELVARGRRSNIPIDRVNAAALVASAFGCYSVAHDAALAEELPLAESLDRAMNAVHVGTVPL